MDKIKQIDEMVAKFDQVTEDLRDSILEYLDNINIKFRPAITLSYRYDPDYEIIELNGNDRQIVTEDDFVFDYDDFEIHKLIELYQAVAQYMEEEVDE
jgi:hypothetical protein